MQSFLHHTQKLQRRWDMQSACTQVFNADTLIWCQASSAFIYLQCAACIQRTWNSPTKSRGGGVDVQLRHGNPRILLQDHNITAESIRQCCTTADNTLLLAPGLHRLTLICVWARRAVYTCFYLLDHQKTHFQMPWRRDRRLIQMFEFGVLCRVSVYVADLWKSVFYKWVCISFIDRS